MKTNPTSWIALIGVALTVTLSSRAQAPDAPAIPAFKKPTELSSELTRERLVGTWYGDQPMTEGGRRQCIMRRASDGTFHVTFRFLHPTRSRQEQIETGEWGLSAGFLITVTRELLLPGGVREKVARRPNSIFWDLYEILELTPTEMTFRAVENGEVFQLKLVPDGFSFPKETK